MVLLIINPIHYDTVQNNLPPYQYNYVLYSTNLAKALASPILPILLLFMRKDEVPTPKHFTVPLVFKTRLNPIQLPFHLPNHRCDIGLSYKRGRL